MSYIDKLKVKRILLKEEISAKEQKFLGIYSSLFNNTQDDIIGRIARRLSLITIFSNGIRIGFSIFKSILNKNSF